MKYRCAADGVRLESSNSILQRFLNGYLSLLGYTSQRRIGNVSGCRDTNCTALEVCVPALWIELDVFLKLNFIGSLIPDKVKLHSITSHVGLSFRGISETFVPAFGRGFLA